MIQMNYCWDNLRLVVYAADNGIMATETMEQKYHHGDNLLPLVALLEVVVLITFCAASEILLEK